MLKTSIKEQSKMALNGLSNGETKPIILEYTPDLAAETADLYERVAHVIP
ncbi:MAG: quinolinate synthase NadA, partial [Alphaproteobacteria bacterium]